MPIEFIRAKKELILSWSARRMVRGEIKRRNSSRFLTEIDPLVLMAYFSFSALISSVPLVGLELIFGYSQIPSNLNAWLTIMYIAFVPSFLAQIFFIKGVELIGASQAGLFINILPIFAAILGVIILGESLQIYHFISLVVVLTGVYTFMAFGDNEKKQ